MPIFYSTRFLNGHAGTVKIFLIPVIIIDPDYKDDEGLLAHEQTHVDQAWRRIFPPIHALLYSLSDKYRLKCEVEAYKKQIQVTVERNPSLRDYVIGVYAGFLSSRYGLNISLDEARTLLEG